MLPVPKDDLGAAPEGRVCAGGEGEASAASAVAEAVDDIAAEQEEDSSDDSTYSSYSSYSASAVAESAKSPFDVRGSVTRLGRHWPSPYEQHWQHGGYWPAAYQQHLQQQMEWDGIWKAWNYYVGSGASGSQQEVPGPMVSHSDEPSTNQGPGTIACLYVYVREEANVDEVAVDLRNQAPTILFVCCSDGEVAESMATALSKAGVDNKPRGDGGTGTGRGAKAGGVANQPRGDGGKGKGGPGRASKEDFQVMFQCVVRYELIIAGRAGIVKEVEIKDFFNIAAGGPLLIAEVGFAVSVQQMLSVRVAIIGLPTMQVITPWGDFARTLERRSVRLLVGEFANQLVSALTDLRKVISVRACAVEPCVRHDDTYWLASSAMLVLGPVGSIKMLVDDDTGRHKWTPLSETRGCGEQLEEPVEKRWKAMKHSLECEPFAGSEDEDESRGWPVIASVKQKQARTVLEHTKKLSVFMGAKSSRRRAESASYRADTRAERANKWAHKSWAQPHRRGKGK